MILKRCKCGTLLMLVKYYQNGRTAPIEAIGSDDGNIQVTGDFYRIVPKEERAELQRTGGLLRKNHFATCKYAGEFAQEASG